MFGCLAYASIHNSDKFAPRAKKGVFIDYPTGQNRYKILDLITKKFFVSRNVVFHEIVFPLLNQSVPSISDPYAILPWIDASGQATPVDFPTSFDHIPTPESSFSDSLIPHSEPFVFSPTAPSHTVSNPDSLDSGTLLLPLHLLILQLFL